MTEHDEQESHPPLSAMNSRRRKIVIILIAAVAGLTSGFAFRWMQRGGTVSGQQPQASRVHSPAADNPRATPATQRQKISPFAAQLEQDLSMSAGVTRWLHWMTAIEEAKLSDFPRLARMAQGNSVALRLVGARWIELNPRHLFDTLEQAAHEDAAAGTGGKFPVSELGNLLFEDWAKRDPDGAIAALSGADGNAARNWRYTVANAVMAKDPERGLRAMSDWHLENYGPVTTGIAAWAANNPRHAAEFALAHPSGFATQNAMDVIGKTWAKTDPEAALGFAANLKDKYGASLASGIVKEWAAKDLAKAAAWLADADPHDRNRLSGQLVEVWAKTDTTGAMDWIQENLSGSGLDEAVGAVLKGAAEKSVTDAASLVTGMEESQARTKAALSVARKWFPDFNSTNKPAAPEAIAWLSSLDPSAVKHVIEQLQWQWGNADPKGLADFLTSPAGQHAPRNAFSSAARQMARQNPEQALEWAARLPAEHRKEATSDVFREWQNSQPVAAMEWIHKLPASDPRRESFYLGIVHNFIPGGPEAELLAKSLVTGSAAARDAVQKLSIPEDRKQKLLDQLQLK